MSVPGPKAKAATPGTRVVAIDGLRGIAATLVVLYHLHGAVSRSASDWLWSPLDWVVRNGYYGVDIFFVISGFVIALSVSKGAPTLGYLGRFVLRRSIRLDPPYWSAILLEILLLGTGLWLFPGLASNLPTWPQIVSHLFYAQDILGYGNIVASFWTLCYEIQFYGFFVGLTVLVPLLPGFLRRQALIPAVGGGLFLLSIYTRYWHPEWLHAGIAIDRWFQFFIGVLTWRAVSGAGRVLPLVAAWLVLGVTVVLVGAQPMQLLAIGVSAWLLADARDPRYGRLFASRPLRFLGTISYSIYLYHASVGWRFVGVIQRLLPGQWSPPLAIAVYLVGIGFSIGFAAVLWRFIEQPCLRLCQRVRLPLRTDVAGTAPAAVTQPA